MYFAHLSPKILSGENKDKPNTVEITAAKLLGEDKKAIVFKIPAEQFSYPQFGPEPAKNEKGEELALTEEQAKEALDEIVKDAGGIVNVIETYNDTTRTAALNKGKNYIRTKETGEPDAIVAQGLAITHNFTWAAAERITNKAIADEARNLVVEADSLDKDELIKRLKALVGQK